MGISVNVKMGEYSNGLDDDILTTTALGSCVGIALYDPQQRIGGLAHIMLPFSHQFRSSDNPAKFADKAIPAMLEKMIGQGANRHRVWAKIAGGAHMFAMPVSSDVMRIGERNVDAVKAVLRQEGIRIIREDTGNNYGRSLEFYLRDGRVLVKTVGHGTVEL